MLIASKQLLCRAREHGYALPAFNTSNIEITKALFAAAEETRSPLLIATTEGAIKYAGLENIFSIINNLSKNSKIPVCIHLDHGKDPSIVKECIGIGYKSVMVDASALPFAQNVKITKSTVKAAHAKKCSVEAELGRLGKIGDAQLTGPEEAKLFAKKTGCDSLAVSIGTSHGAFKFSGEPKIDLQRLQEISEAVPVPLVLHGASSLDSEVVERANSYGASLHGTAGVPHADLLKAIKLGVAKINIDTDLRIAFTAGLRQFLAENPGSYDPRDSLGFAAQYVKEMALKKINLFGARNSAK